MRIGAFKAPNASSTISAAMSAAMPQRGLAADIAALIVEEAFGALKAPILKVAPPHTPVPYAPTLEDAYLPDAGRIAAAVRRVVAYA